MSRRRSVVLNLLAVSMIAGWCHADVATWQFDGDLTPSTGAGALDLVALGFPGVAGAPGVTFASEMVGGAPADIAEFTEGTAFQALHGLLANGGGGYLNNYTLLMDARFVDASSDWVALYQTNDCDPAPASTELTCTNDGDWFIRPEGGIGISGNYGGTVPANGWVRLALVVDAAAGTYTSYIDGAQVQQNTGVGVDGRYALYTTDDGDPASDSVFIFADETGVGEMSGGAINSLCLLDTALPAATIAALGGPTAAGLPSTFNDDCASAETLAIGSTVSGSTQGMAPDATFECGTADNASPAVWYSLVGNGNFVVLSLCDPGTTFDTKLHVYKGGCGALECVAGNDDGPGVCANPAFHSEVRLAANFGVTYQIKVYGFGAGDFGDFVLRATDTGEVIPLPSPNETCVEAIALDFSGFPTAVVTGSTALNLTDPENDECGDSTSPGIWYSLTGNGATITASTCGAANFDTLLSVFSGACDALTCVVANDDTGGCAGATSVVSWDSEIGVEYSILVHGFRDFSGNFTLTVTRPTPPCVRLLDCQADNDAGTLSVAWESFAVGQDGFDISANGALVATAAPAARDFSWTPELVPGRLNDFRITVAVAGDAVENCGGGAESCTLWLSPGNVCLAETFEDYADDVALEVDGGWLPLDENTPAEDATWTIGNPGGRANPPTVDGTPTFGNFAISDSDDAGGDNPTGSGMSHDLWSPAFSLEGKTEAWLHADVSAQLNNNGKAVFDVDVSIDDGATWTNVYRRIAPARDAAPTAIANAALTDGFYGRLDVDLSSVAGRPAVHVRFRHFEPSDDWWIAIDNVVVDDVAPLAPAESKLYTEEFDFGLGTASAVSLLGNTCRETWHTSDKGGRRAGVGNFDGRGANRLGLRPAGVDFVACLSGAQEAPAPVASDGTGDGAFLFDPATRELSFTIRFSGLTSAETNAHIHRAPAGMPAMAGPVAHGLPAGSPKEGAVTLSEDQVAALLAGELYVNVHSADHPTGELRGQILPHAGFAILESDANPDPAEDEWLVTPSIDCSLVTEVRLHWLSETVASGVAQEVLVSLDGGASYLERKLFDYRGGGAVDLGEEPFYARRGVVVPEAAGESNVVFAFHWVGQDDWWWAVDDVCVSGIPKVLGNPQRPCDFNQDGNFDLSDAVSVLNHLFLGGAAPPCGDNTIAHRSNIALLDANGSGAVDLSDAVFKLNFLFLGGPPPVGGTNCIVIEDCPVADCQ